LLNRLSLNEPVWLASDIHLGADNPVTAQRFFQFLDQASAQAGALLLLGDIFDVWIGDDWIEQPPSWLSDALAHLKSTAQRCPLWIGRGNRDFLLNQRLAKAIGAQLLDAQVILEVAGNHYLLAHGDEFCTNDRAYQRFRRIVRNRWVQKAFLSLSLNTRTKIAQKARHQSMLTQTVSDNSHLDVCEKTIAAVMAKEKLGTIIHGHTHRPDHHQFASDTVAFDRWVLPDWESDHLSAAQPERGGWIVVDQAGVALFDLAAQKIK